MLISRGRNKILYEDSLRTGYPVNTSVKEIMGLVFFFFKYIIGRMTSDKSSKRMLIEENLYV